MVEVEVVLPSGNLDGTAGLSFDGGGIEVKVAGTGREIILLQGWGKRSRFLQHETAQASAVRILFDTRPLRIYHDGLIHGLLSHSILSFWGCRTTGSFQAPHDLPTIEAEYLIERESIN